MHNWFRYCHHPFGSDSAQQALVQHLQMMYCWLRVCCNVWVGFLSNNMRLSLTLKAISHISQADNLYNQREKIATYE